MRCVCGATVPLTSRSSICRTCLEGNREDLDTYYPEDYDDGEDYDDDDDDDGDDYPEYDDPLAYCDEY